MANAYNPSAIKSTLAWGNSFNPTGAFPLDFRAYFASYAEAQAAAATAADFGSADSAYHFGQQLYVFDGTHAKTYLIQGDRTLLEIGKSDAMLFVADESALLALTDIEAGQQVYREDTHTIWLYKGGDVSDINNWAESASQNDTVWEGTEDKVTFEALTQSAFDAADTKSATKLYFVTDTGRIFKGSSEVTKSVNFVEGSVFPEASAAVQGRLYIDKSSYEIRTTFDGSTWMTVSPGYISDYGNWVPTNTDGMLATKAVIKQAIADAIAGVELELAYDAAIGKITVGQQEATLTNVAHDVTWNSDSATLTVKMFGQAEDLVVEIGKEKFVKSGKYYENYPETGEPTHHNVIVLEVENGDPIIIPAEALVNVYTADNINKDIVVTVSSDNKISAAAKIDPVEGNALVSSASGLKVDLSSVNTALEGKVSKVVDGTEDNIATLTADGSIKDSTYSIQVEGDMTEGTKIPTAALVASAITTAVSAAQGTLQSAIDSLKSTVDGHTTTINQIQENLSNIATTLLSAGEENEVITSTATGIQRSGKKIGTMITDAPSNDVIATEKMVVDAMSWSPLI